MGEGEGEIAHSTELRGGACHRSSKASRGKDVEVEEPVVCRYSSAFDFHPTLAGMLSPTLRGDQVIKGRQPCPKRLLAPFAMMESLHGEPFPLNGVVGLVSQGAGRWHLQVFEDRIPARFLVLEPSPSALPVGHPYRGGDVVSTVAEPLTQRKHAQALALARPVPQGVQLRAQGLADRRRDGGQFPRELVERVAQTVPQARTRKERAHALGGTVEAIRQDAPD